MRVGIDIQVVTGGNRGGLFHCLRHLIHALRPLVSDELYLIAESGRKPGLTRADAKTTSAAFDGARVCFIRQPRRFYRLWHRLSRFNRVEVLVHNQHGRLPSSTRGANVFVVPDVIPLAIDYGIPGYADECRSYYERAVRTGDAVIVWSDHTKSDLLARVGGSPDRIHVCPLAAGPEFMPNPRPRRLPDLQGKPYVLTVSTVEKRKNHAVLLRAFARMLGADPALPHQLVIVGGKWVGHEAVFELVERLGLPDRVHYLGYADPLVGLYQGASAFVFPSVYEGFGLPPLEAMACGIPVLSAQATALPEVVGDAGILFHPDDDATLASKLHRVLTDHDHHADLSARGLGRAATFSWRRTAEQYLNAFEAGIAHRKLSGGAR